MKFQHPLDIVTRRVLEDWAMMLLEESEDRAELFSFNRPVYKSFVGLQGVINGTLSIYAEEDFIKALTGNLLGQDLQTAEASIDPLDAFREMGNVMAGNFVTEAYGEDAVFDLIGLTVKPVGREEVEQFLKSKILFTYMADAYPVAVSFNIEG